MFSLPALPPSWDGYHPLVVHFPIALLMSAPVLIVLGLLLHRHRHPLNLAALIVMALGAAGAWMAVSTGEAAEEFVDEVGAIGSILHEHEEAAEMAWRLAMVMTGLFAAYTFIPWIMKKELPRKWTALAGVLFLLAYTAPCLTIANAAHLGGKLVHEHGVRARLSTGAAGPEAAPTTTSTGANEEDDD